MFSFASFAGCSALSSGRFCALQPDETLSSGGRHSPIAEAGSQGKSGDGVDDDNIRYYWWKDNCGDRGVILHLRESSGCSVDLVTRQRFTGGAADSMHANETNRASTGAREPCNDLRSTGTSMEWMSKSMSSCTNTCTAWTSMQIRRFHVGTVHDARG